LRAERVLDWPLPLLFFCISRGEKIERVTSCCDLTSPVMVGSVCVLFFREEIKAFGVTIDLAVFADGFSYADGMALAGAAALMTFPKEIKK